MDFDVQVFEKKPEGFAPLVEVASCYIEVEGKLLLLQNALGRREPGKWGVPAGKVEIDEPLKDAAVRELFEETGIRLEDPSQIEYIKPLYIRKPDVSYVYHMFKLKLPYAPDICLSGEHQNYAWTDPQDLEKMPLMAGAEQALQNYRASLLG